MKCASLSLAIFMCITHFLAKSTAQVDKSNNRALLPTRNDCGRFNLAEFEERSGAVAANEFPWIAKIAYNQATGVSYNCLAVLINERYLLAAAHCLEHMRTYEPFAVLFGDFASITEVNRAQQISIGEIVIHPYYNLRKKINDIALIRLSRSVSYTDSVRPICLPAASVQSKEFGAEQLILGGYYMRDDSRELHKLPVVVSNTIDCNRKYSDVINVTDTHLCGISCYQGSRYMAGSPLMDVDDSKYYLAGLVSAGRSFCTYPEQPDIFTRIDRYLDWIFANVVA